MDFLVSNFNNVLREFNLYYLDSKYFLLFILAIIVNFFTIKRTNKNERILLIWLPIILILIIFNPVVFKLLDPFIGEGEGDTYWRMFWILPIAPILGYSFTNLANLSKSKFKIAIISASLMILIALSGKLVYSKENYQIANNWYKMPAEVLDVIQTIQSQDVDYKKIYAPSNMVEWVRQYDGNIDLVYGRNPAIIVYMGREIDAGRLKDNMDRIFNYEKCNFIVTLKDVEYDVNLEDYNFKKIGTTNSYVIYMLIE